jgi:NitT/TauT family transport system substrate-binding protein
MRRLAPFSLAIGVALLASACGGSDPSSSSGGGGGGSSEGQLDQVTVGVIPIIDAVAVYVGNEKGFFKERNIELNIELAQGGAAIVPAVLSGQTQFGFSNNVSMIIAASQGVPIQLVTPGVASTGKDGEDFQGVAVPGDSPAQTAADLENATIGVNTLNNICHVSINESIRKAGGDPAGVNYVEVPAPDMVAALNSGQVEAACLGEPFLGGFLRAGGRTVASNFVDVAEDATIASYFTSKKLAQEDPDLVKRFTEAMVESLEYTNEHLDEARQAVTTYTALTQDQVAELVMGKYPTEFNRESIERIAELAKQDGLIDEVPDLDELLP